MTYTKKTQTPFIKMYIKGSYDNFDDFYDVNKKPIYEKSEDAISSFIYYYTVIWSIQ